MQSLLHLTPFLGVFGLTTLFSIYHQGFNKTLHAYRGALIGHKTTEVRTESFSTWAMIAGHICATMGLIDLMGNLSDPGKLGDGVAVVIISYLYAVLLAAILPAPKSVAARHASMLAPACALALTFLTVLYAISNAAPEARSARLVETMVAVHGAASDGQ